MDDNICSHILKFADDTKIVGPVATEKQISILQQDLVQVFRWKAKQIVGMIRMTYEDRSKNNIVPLYKSLVGPHFNQSINQKN